ncbi:uncharacterized protein ACLA_091570 [Aspergillus clavatus NRRL 1]|uniref:Uncharacterized protein n=1 Tax=Aspergillus clavatus (strain ATCC 1007 / CBS 513.65 / DSM 816 / NCTC 3887 / NRRL 1 / QM 1276 / 107) TaxID=344612 RepID=A1CF10_ASPCL|nr:uncharacterized protein ACLA_091570 [Aspergillus clavatus NRRL 1]EAW11459.1 hypothetical protein ACLA_091570 [Aspergillus clavatus NRRL 1]
MELHNHKLFIRDNKDVSTPVDSAIVLNLFDRSDIVSPRFVLVGIVPAVSDCVDTANWVPLEFGVTKDESLWSSMLIQVVPMPSAPARSASLAFSEYH